MSLRRESRHTTSVGREHSSPSTTELTEKVIVLATNKSAIQRDGKHISSIYGQFEKFDEKCIISANNAPMEYLGPMFTSWRLTSLEKYRT